MSRNPKRLNRILRIREQQEEIARAEWLAAQARVRETQAEAEASREQWRAGQRQVRASLAVVNPERTLLAQTALDQILSRTQDLQAIAQRVRAAAELKRQPWIQARQTLRAMERLHERAVADWMAEQNEREDKRQNEATEAHMACREETLAEPAAPSHDPSAALNAGLPSAHSQAETHLGN